MQSGASSSQQFAARAPAPPFTPSQSFNGSAQPADSQTMDWADKQAKEHEVARSRLSDPRFNIRDYPDPLLPRQHAPPHYYPAGVMAELETHLLNVVARIKATGA